MNEQVKYVIDVQHIEHTLQYLATKPYAEVAELIAALRSGELLKEDVQEAG